jgi:sugar lactone lactonase YvrE
MKPEVAIAAADDLGEGAFWDERQGLLLRVDINRGLILALDPKAGEQHEVRRFSGPVSFAIPCRSGGFVAGLGHEVARLGRGPAEDSVIARVETDQPGNRLNDGRCDARGRLWAGTMSGDRTPGVAALYCFEPDGRVACELGGATISNGKDWSADGTTLYYADSLTYRIDAYACDVMGLPDERRALVKLEPDEGLPDGLAVDAEGGVWVALFGGSAIRRYSPAGELTAVIELPVSNPTSLAFGGDRLEHLYVTTARHRLDSAQLQDQPLAGAVFVIEPGVVGRSAHRFAG